MTNNGVIERQTAGFRDDLHIDMGATNVNQSSVDSFWAESNYGIELKKIIEDKAVSTDSRFIACEVLFAKQPDWYEESIFPSVAEIYTSTLKKNEYDGTVWGLPSNEIWPTNAGRHLVLTGNRATQWLKEMINDERQIMFTIGDTRTMTYQCRIKDIAFFSDMRNQENSSRPELFPSLPGQPDCCNTILNDISENS